MGEVVPFKITKFNQLAFGQIWRIRLGVQRQHFSGRMTSITLEAEFWIALEIICDKEKMPLSKVLAKIYAAKKKEVSIASAARIFVMSYLMTSIATEQDIKEAFKKIACRYSYPDTKNYNTQFKVISC